MYSRNVIAIFFQCILLYFYGGFIILLDLCLIGAFGTTTCNAPDTAFLTGSLEIAAVSKKCLSFGSGKINQQDFNKFLRLVPLGQPWYLRYLSNKLTESLDLPKNRNHAKGWFEKG